MTPSRFLAATSLAAVTAGPGLAAPAVVADIAPVHSIVARVMEGVGTPDLLLPPGATPHGYALRPSEAAMLEGADVVFWVGEDLSPWLAGPLATIAAGARPVALMQADGVRLLPVREGGPFEAHDHDHDHGHGHDHDEDHDHAHADDHGDADAAYDAHIWLDPVNAAAIAAAAADVLAEADPENAAAYRANAEAFADEISGLVAEVATELAALERTGFIVFHDAYQYFEDRFGVAAAGSVALHDADQPSAARIGAIQERVRAAGVACVFAEPQFEPRLIETATEGSDARAGVLDPLGAGLEPGPDLYPTLIRDLAADLRACLDG